MTAAVAPLPVPLHLPDSSMEARKRRREILATQRSAALEAPLTISTPATVSDSENQPKKRKVGGPGNTKPNVKKPQMKYDPDVPMSKEEAATWRREQRRKRNRESAAASRQRQRDRITELEGEVGEWKTKFEVIMEKIKELEEASGKSADDLVGPWQSRPLEEHTSKFVSPPPSPGHSPLSPPVASPILSSTMVTAAQVTPKEGTKKQLIGRSELEHSDNLISRPAVKIADAPPLPLLPTSGNSILPPDACLSAPAEVKLDPIDSSLFPVKEEKLPTLLSDEETEDEFGEFLLDAVQWL